MPTQTIPISALTRNRGFLTLSINWSDTEEDEEPAVNYEKLGITRAEHRVLQMIGHSDKEIAAELFMSEHTVRTHFRNILNKKGFSNKVVLATWASKQGLI